jgi:hypothetical protein
LLLIQPIWHRRLLRARRERPRGRCYAEKRDELATPHSSTSSAIRGGVCPNAKENGQIRLPDCRPGA